jgi:hypothetical protein
LSACEQALAALRAAQPPGAWRDVGFGPAPGTAPCSVAPQQVKLQLGAAPLPHPASRSPGWWLTDAQGRALDLHAPLLDDITAGRGITLALWAHRGAGAEAEAAAGAAAGTETPAGSPGGWICLRRLHIATSARPREALATLPGALARLLWQAGVDQLLGAAPPGPAVAAPGALVDGPADAQPARPARLPAALLHLRGHARAWWALQQARWCREQWRIGVLDCSPATLAAGGALPAPRWLPAYAGMGYWADPAAQPGSDSRILAEYFDEARGIGRIERLHLGPEGQVRERHPLPLGQGRHASFAHAMQADDGRWLGLAETAALRECELHEVQADGRWHKIASLLPGLAAADPALFQWQGRWWLACTDIDQGAMDNLCLFHAPRPEGPWQPHANNPVKLDVRGARMAGAFFWHEGQLYRPAQDCLGSYGAAVVLYRVLHCSPERYAEEPVRRLAPDPHGPCPHGLHTLSAWGSRWLVDGKRHVFSPGLGWMKLRRRLARGRAA